MLILTAPLTRLTGPYPDSSGTAFIHRHWFSVLASYVLFPTFSMINSSAHSRACRPNSTPTCSRSGAGMSNFQFHCSPEAIISDACFSVPGTLTRVRIIFTPRSPTVFQSAQYTNRGSLYKIVPHLVDPSPRPFATVLWDLLYSTASRDTISP